MLITSLSYLPNYTFVVVRKIYSTKCVGKNGFKVVEHNGPDDTKALNKAGEISLTKQCDQSLKRQAQKYHANAVLGVHYSIAIDSCGSEESKCQPAGTMYAYGEAVKLKKFM